MKHYSVGFSGSVDKKSRFHVCYKLGMTKSARRTNRGKYRSARTVIDGVKINTVCWQDRALIGFTSTMTGTSEMKDTRRKGRHEIAISCPKMVVVRGQNFRAVDSNDQMRLGKHKFQIISRTKAWPVIFWGVMEILLTNIYLVLRCCKEYKNLLPRDFRWQLITEILEYAILLDDQEDDGMSSDVEHASGLQEMKTSKIEIVSRFHDDAVQLHHHVKIPEYVTQIELDELHDLHKDDPKKPRQKQGRKNGRDVGRRNRRGELVYRNPYWHNSQCVVCWGTKKEKWTSKYCRECVLDPSWKYKIRVGSTFNRYHPRLCSPECWKLFHTQQIFGLDYSKRCRKQMKNTRSRANSTVITTPSMPRPVRKTNQKAVVVNFSV